MSKKQTFEESIQRLQAIVEKLESGDLTLDEALSQFEKGIKLSRQCTTLLNRAETRIKKLTHDDHGQTREEPFSLAEDEQ